MQKQRGLYSLTSQDTSGIESPLRISLCRVDYFVHSGALDTAFSKVGIDRSQPIVELFDIGLAVGIGGEARCECWAVERQHKQRQFLAQSDVDPANGLFAGHAFGSESDSLEQPKPREA